MNCRTFSCDESRRNECRIECDLCEHDQEESWVGHGEDEKIRLGLDGTEGSEDAANGQDGSDCERSPAEFHVQPAIADADKHCLDEEEQHPGGHRRAMD